MKATEICLEAANIVGGDRAKTHGNALSNYRTIAALWTCYLKNAGIVSPNDSLSATDAALMMVLLKVARTQGGAHNHDDFLDIAGYGALAGEIASSERR